MSGTAKKTDPALWETVKQRVTAGDKGGKPGQWSARKAQLAVREYQREGGGYLGDKPADNALAHWTEEDWGTRSGKPSGETGERYLPERARASLSRAEYARTSRKKRADSRRGQQHSAQPEDIARKTAAERAPSLGRLAKPELLRRAAERNIAGRSRMNKVDLIEALKRAGEA
ncbi:MULTISPECIES: Rho termination factor N-terminal domain-containing protein [Pseudomonas]|uniref:Rho termination factor N-terminal domain-containing protein n=1 Tax=Pseudomonas TaxID=286 RepID=UPI00257D6319|nr:MULTISPECIES: Rho termination factor N-terminal domain-containing protein [Pseudomonas]